MNFKLFLLLLLTFSCGLKTRPKAPNNTKLPSLIDEYSYKTTTTKKKTEKKSNEDSEAQQE